MLSPNDPLPFERLKPDGKGRLLILCDHASHAVPKALDGLGLDAGDLHRHIGWDVGAADMTRILAERFDAPAVLAGYSRLVIDCNRRLDDPQSILAESEGTPVPGNRDLTPEQAAARAEACFRPYHRAVQAMIEERLARDVVPAVVAMHSFTSVFHGNRRSCHVGVMWDRDSRIAEPLIEILSRDPAIKVGANEPYSGASPYEYTLPVHAARRGLPHAQIEVRQDLVATSEGVLEWTQILGDALEDVLADPALYRIKAL